jgi:hypothetical protein
MPAYPNALIETEFVTSPGPNDKKSTSLMATQSSCTTLENYLPAIDYLLGVFEEAKVRYRCDPFMVSRVNLA